MPLSNTALGKAQIDLVIFDCDGVLVDSEILSKRVLLSMLSDLGVVASGAYFDQYFLGRSYESVTSQIYKDYEVELSSHFRQDYQDELLQVFANELVPTKHLQWMLSKLQRNNCVATSSSPERVNFALTTTKILPHFKDRIFTASEVKNGKPAPDLFLHSAKKMGVSPNNCLVIEDSQAGIEAGLAAKMHVIKYAGASHFDSIPNRQSDIIDDIATIYDWSQFYELLPALQSTP